MRCHPSAYTYPLSSELKELIAMHADDHPQGQGGELKHDTAAIIGHTLDLQEKVVSDAMTGIDKVNATQ